MRGSQLVIANENLIEEICSRYNLTITKEIEDFVLQEYGEEQFPETFSEIELYFVVRDCIYDCLDGKINVCLKTPYEIVLEDRKKLRSMYLDRLNEISTLNSRIMTLESVIAATKQSTSKLDEDISF